jgi:hypothetical protein
MAAMARRRCVEPGRSVVRTLVLVALLAGVAGDPGPSSSQESPYRVMESA